LDRALRVVLGTGMERLEHVLRLIGISFTRIGCLFHLRTSSTVDSVTLQIRTLFSNFYHVFLSETETESNYSVIRFDSIRFRRIESNPNGGAVESNRIEWRFFLKESNRIESNISCVESNRIEWNSLYSTHQRSL